MVLFDTEEEYASFIINPKLLTNAWTGFYLGSFLVVVKSAFNLVIVKYALVLLCELSSTFNFSSAVRTS